MQAHMSVRAILVLLASRVSKQVLHMTAVSEVFDIHK